MSFEKKHGSWTEPGPATTTLSYLRSLYGDGFKCKSINRCILWNTKSENKTKEEHWFPLILSLRNSKWTPFWFILAALLF